MSDSHGGKDNRWRGSPNNFVSWIWAAKPDKQHFIEGLRKGRVFFGDLERFDGELDLDTEDGARMGATVRARGPSVRVQLIAHRLKGGERIVVVESGQRTSIYQATTSDFEQWHELRLPSAGPAFVRFEVQDDTGPIGLSNPIYFTRD